MAQILYDETDPAAIQDLEEIEKTVRQHLLKQVGPELESTIKNDLLT